MSFAEEHFSRDAALSFKKLFSWYVRAEYSLYPLEEESKKEAMQAASEAKRVIEKTKE
ncbi:hypothetical protein H5U35_04295 [Candidatus Aerophobetes bacterium]|nr:hypothetical protein [Candidatus Aerophobetes bacterium]